MSAENAKDVEMEDVGSECSDDGSEIEDVSVEIEETQRKLKEDPKNIALTNNLLELFKKNGDFEELDELRKNAVKWCPLSSTNWISWIQDAREKKCGKEEIDKMFEKAVGDSNDTAIWVERVYYGLSIDLDTARKHCEMALSAIGTRFDCGGHIWILYLSFERTHIDSLEPGNDRDQAIQRVISLFKRALRVPTSSLEEFYQDAQQFCEEIGDETHLKEFETIFASTMKFTRKLEEFERKIEDSKNKTDAFQQYLNFENENGDMGRIQMMHERIVAEFEEDEYAWSNYGNWCEQKLKIPMVTLQVYDRAIRHCPYSCLLHQQALLAFERANQPTGRIDAIFTHAKENVINTPEDGRSLYRTYIYLLRRRVVKSETNDYTYVAKIFDEGARKLKEWFPYNWDPKGDYRQNQAHFYAAIYKDIEKTRNIWQDILASGFGKNAQKWIEAARMERQFGSLEVVRKYLNKAINSVSDNINDVYEYYLQFEREEGTLAQLDAALEKINSQVAHRAARPQKKVVEKEVKQTSKRDHSDQPIAKKIKAESGAVFKKPDNRAGEHDAQPSASSNGASAPDDETARTVFVSNLDFGTTEEDIRKVIEGVEKVRFASRAKSDLHRGFGYVVLSDVAKSKAALKNDRVLVNGRPMFISQNDPEKRVGFKYSTGLEKSKVFVRNVHFKANEDDLKEVFSKFGTVTNVRLVRHKNGQPKGVAYVDFEKEEDAQKCIMGGSQLVLKERELIVALSNPPAKEKKTEEPMEESSATVPRKGHAGMLQFVPRATKTSTVPQKPANSSGTAPKPMSNEMFRQFLSKQ